MRHEISSPNYRVNRSIAVILASGLLSTIFSLGRLTEKSLGRLTEKLESSNTETFRVDQIRRSKVSVLPDLDADIFFIDQERLTDSL